MENSDINVTTSGSGLPVHYHHVTFIYIRVIGACALAIIGFPLNVCALVIIRVSGRRQHTQSTLVTYLCVIETLTSALVLPTFAYDQWSMSGLHHPALCKTSVFVTFALQANIPMAFLLIAIHRFLLVARPFPALVNFGGVRGTHACILAAVCVVMVTLVPPLFDVGALFRQSEITGICTSLVRAHTLVYNGVTQGVMLSVPALLMSACYLRVLSVIRRQNRRLAAANPGVIHIPSVQHSIRRRKHVIRVTALSAIAVSVFFVTYMPFILSTLFPRQLDTYLYSAVSSVLTFSHTVTSPLIYVLGDSELRGTLLKVITRRNRVAPEVGNAQVQPGGTGNGDHQHQMAERNPGISKVGVKKFVSSKDKDEDKSVRKVSALTVQTVETDVVETIA